MPIGSTPDSAAKVSRIRDVDGDSDKGDRQTALVTPTQARGDDRERIIKEERCSCPAGGNDDKGDPNGVEGGCDPAQPSQRQFALLDEPNGSYTIDHERNQGNRRQRWITRDSRWVELDHRDRRARAKPRRSQATARSRSKYHSFSSAVFWRLFIGARCVAGRPRVASHANLIADNQTTGTGTGSGGASNLTQIVVARANTAEGFPPLSVSLPHQHERRFEAVVHFKFIEDVGQMGFDGLFTDENFLADLLVGQSLGDQFENLHLTFGQ